MMNLIRSYQFLNLVGKSLVRQIFELVELENVSVFELLSIRIIHCNLAILLVVSKHLKMTEAIWIIEFLNCLKVI